MKKICLAVMILLVVPATAGAAGLSLDFGGGYGGPESAPNLSFDLGFLWGEDTAGKRGKILGLGATFIVLGKNEVPSGVYDYECPHDDYTLEKYDRNLEWGILGKFGVEVVADKHFYILGMGGRTQWEEKYIAQSNATGWYYDHGSDYHHNALYGAGFGYFNTIMLELDIDNRRGITALIGAHF